MIKLHFKQLFMLIFILTVHPLSAQVIWSNDNTLEQLKIKARSEGKLIFLDCAASWCVPCKDMDMNVYTRQEVFQKLNDRFVNVKLQIDSTPLDDAAIRARYEIANLINSRYQIKSFPSYLFLSGEGDLVYRGKGAMEVDRFSSLLNEAETMGSRLDKQLIAWRRNGIDMNELPSMINFISGVLADRTNARMLARDAIDFLKKEQTNKIYDSSVLTAVLPWVSYSDTKLVDLFYPESNGIRTDSILKIPGFSKSSLAVIIGTDLRSRLILDDHWTKPISTNPNWPSIIASLHRRFGLDLVDKQVLEAKRTFYSVSAPNWDLWARVTIDYYERYAGISHIYRNIERTTMGVNNDLWNGVFKHIKDRKLLLKAAALQRSIVDQYLKYEPLEGSNAIDTYANLLYKAGKKKLAIHWQHKAINFRKLKEETRGDKQPASIFSDNLEKMIKGLPTWTNL